MATIELKHTLALVLRRLFYVVVVTLFVQTSQEIDIELNGRSHGAQI